MKEALILALLKLHPGNFVVVTEEGLEIRLMTAVLTDQSVSPPRTFHVHPPRVYALYRKGKLRAVHQDREQLVLAVRVTDAAEKTRPGGP